MRVLALDSTTRPGSVAIVDDDRVLVEHVGDSARSHAERLPLDMLAALDAARCKVIDIDVFAVASGPGSFTGLRIGIAAIQGLAVVSRKRVVPVSALEALAELGGRGLAPGSLVGSWMDAYRRDVFSALYRVDDLPMRTGEWLEEIEPASVGDPVETLTRWTRSVGLPVTLVGDGAERYATVVPEGVSVTKPAPLAPVIGRMAARRARIGKTVSPAGIQPLYVRRPDAETARDLRAKKDALDPSSP